MARNLLHSAFPPTPSFTGPIRVYFSLLIFPIIFHSFIISIIYFVTVSSPYQPVIHLCCQRIDLPSLWRNSPTRTYAASLYRFLNHTQLDTHTHTHRAGRTPLDEWSARRRGRYPHNTQQTQQKNLHALSEIRIRDPTNWAAAELRLRSHDHRDRLK
jgi:hypothetical protein